MAPPKRKTGGGRVTPKGTRPGETHHATSHDHHTVAASSRYTPKKQRGGRIPPNWIPVIMLTLLIVGGLVIMANYLVFDGSNIAIAVGLACILGGLWTATKWQ